MFYGHIVGYKYTPACSMGVGCISYYDVDTIDYFSAAAMHRALHQLPYCSVWLWQAVGAASNLFAPGNGYPAGMCAKQGGAVFVHWPTILFRHCFIAASRSFRFFFYSSFRFFFRRGRQFFFYNLP